MVPNDQLPAWYAHAWAYILPSFFEGMPKTLLEAMACGTPCLATNVEGIRDLVVDGTNGILVEPTPEGIAVGLRLFASDSALRNRVRFGGRQFVVEHFSLDAVLEREVQLLKGYGT
jgi:glycosyltransferase involved in cell wall biosynthesis